MTNGSNVGNKHTAQNAPIKAADYLCDLITGNIPGLHDKLIGADADTFGAGVTMPRVNQIDVQFHSGEPEDLTDVIIDTGSGSSVKTEGLGVISSGTDVTMQYALESKRLINYNSGHEVYLYQTLAWTQPPTSAGDLAEGGLCNSVTGNGYTWAYKGTTWGIRYVRNGVEVDFIPQTSFTDDSLTGDVDSTFTRDGTPEAIDLTNLNVFRVRFGWLSAAPTHFEVMAPDGHWVRCHIIRHPNLSASAQTITPNLPGLINIQKFGTDATDITMLTGCWGGGVVANIPTGETPDGKFQAKRSGGEHSANTTSTPLTAGSVYRGEWFRWSDGDYAGAITDVLSDQNGTLQIDFSFSENPVNGDDTSVDQTIPIAYVANDNFRRVTPTQAKWVRIRYINGVVDQTTFELETIFITTAVPLVMAPSGRAIDDEFLSGMVTNSHQAKDSLGVWGLVGRGGAGDGADSHITDSEPRAVRKPLTRKLVSTHDLTVTSTQLDSSQLASRSAVLLTIDPDNNQAVHINLGSSATTASMKLDAGYGIPLTISNAITIHGRSASGTQRVYLWQFGEDV